MEICDYSSLYQLLAAFLIVFVAIDHVEKYAEIVCNRIFGLKDYINKKFDGCRACLIDESTLSSLKPVDINGKSTLSMIEKLKIDNDKLNQKIKKQQDDFKEQIQSAFYSDWMSHSCLLLFVYCVIALLCGAIEKTYDVYYFYFVFSILCFVHIFISWFVGDKEFVSFLNKVLNYKSCMYALVYLMVFLILSLIVYFIPWHFQCPDIECFLLPFSLFPFLNFLVYAFKIYYLKRKIVKNINESCLILINEGRDLNKIVNNLHSVDQLLMDD